jgi:hypothetical protein
MTAKKEGMSVLVISQKVLHSNHAFALKLVSGERF